MNWEQLRTILWLRWRITRNQWARQGGIGAIIAVFVGLGALVVGGLSFVAALFGAAAGLGRAPPSVVWVTWLIVTLAFLFFWMIGLLTELQRSETIDLQRLMHLPVAIGPIFVINYLASHLALSLVVCVPLMLGLAIGLAVSRGPAMLLLVPLALGMVSMVTAWTYHLRGWLTAMITNPRRRRAIIMGLTLGIVLVVQVPNLYFSLARPGGRSSAGATTTEEIRRQRAARQGRLKENVLIAQAVIPPLWLPAGAQALAEGHSLPALLGALGCFAIGALGLERAYRATLRFYRGDGGAKVPSKSQSARKAKAYRASAKSGARFVERRLPWLPEQSAALALASFRSMVRAPEVKIAWATSLLMPGIAAAFFLRSAPRITDSAKPFIVTAIAALSIFMLVQFLSNQFGFDRDGFRALILFPAERRDILLGKNVAALPLVMGGNLFLVTGTGAWLRLPLLASVATLFQLATMVMLAGLAGNVLSILFPYRVSAGSLKPTKMPGASMLVFVVFQLLFPSAMAPVFAAPLAELLWREAGYSRAVPVNLLLSAALAGFVALVYWRMLGPLGRLLQRRETMILAAVTSEVE
jgi:hypothetical protein